LDAGKSFLLGIENKIEIAAFLPTQNAMLNDAEFKKESL